MECERRRAVLDDGLLAPGHGVADHRRTHEATSRHRVRAGERWRPGYGDPLVGPTLGAAEVAGSPWVPGRSRVRATPGDGRATPTYWRAGVRPVEHDTVPRVG